MLLSIFNVASMDTDIWRHATQLINWYASLYSMGYLASLAYIYAYAIVKLLSSTS